LDQVDQRFSKDMEIPIYQRKKADFNLIVKADFLLDVDGKKLIIDISGLGSDIISMLREQQYRILTLSGEKDIATIVVKTLHFLGHQSEEGPHHFFASEREASRNIQISMPGVIFINHKGRKVLATHLSQPQDIVDFLSQKGYQILYLPFS